MYVCQYDGKVRQLKQRIEKTRKHLLQKHKKKDTLHSKSVHVLADILNTEEQINKLKYSVELLCMCVCACVCACTRACSLLTILAQ